jgi:hypothetical protein
MLFPFSALLEKKVPYIALQNCKPEENRFRIYLIQFREEQGSFVVDLSRGRMDHPAHHKQEFFHEKSQFFSFLKSNIATRKRHGYSLVEMSLDFPVFKNLCEKV